MEGGAADTPASGPERTRAWVVEQLAGVCSLEATSESSLQLAVHYLALQAFFEVDASAVSSIFLNEIYSLVQPNCFASLQTVLAVDFLTVPVSLLNRRIGRVTQSYLPCVV